MFAVAHYHRPESPINIGRLFEQFLARHELTKKDAAYDLGLRNEAISRAIQGTGPLDLWALSRFSTELLVAFLKSIVRARVEAELEDIVADKKTTAKADLPDTLSTKRSA